MIISHTKRATDTKQLEKDDQENLLRGKLEDLDILRHKVLILQDHESLERSLAQYREEMQDLEKKRKEFQDAAYLEKQAVLKECNEFIAYCMDLKGFQEKMLNELTDYVACQDPLLIVLSPSEEELLESM
jgi:phosphoribosyl 1,2-cyclic phosphodiesterase